MIIIIIIVLEHFSFASYKDRAVVLYAHEEYQGLFPFHNVTKQNSIENLKYTSFQIKHTLTHPTTTILTEDNNCYPYYLQHMCVSILQLRSVQ